jgi:RNA polymerase sigma-70 factor (ECF subfamily)
MRLKKKSDQNDSELIRAIHDSDGEAFRILFHRYYESLFAFLWTRTRSADLSKDFIQEVFTRFWQHRQTVDPDQGCKSYLFRIADHLLIDHFRSQSSKNAARDNLRSQSEPAASDPDLQITLQNAVSALPDPVRRVFLLSRYEGYTHQEIAQMERISVKTVESRMTQALKKLREALIIK